MTPQAKNRILGYIVLGMLALVLIVGLIPTQPEPTGSVTILIPKDQPVLATVTEVPAYDMAEFECMRTNLYFEAGNQTDRGMEAVALVTRIRTETKGYPSTVCGVVTVKAFNKRKGRWECAFSWYCDGKSDTPNLHNKLEREAWERATAIAQRAMEGKIKNFLGRATHYHANYVNPDWAGAKRFRQLAVVGTHIFYNDTWRKHKA